MDIPKALSRARRNDICWRCLMFTWRWPHIGLLTVAGLASIIALSGCNQRPDPSKTGDFTNPEDKEPFLGIYAREGNGLKLCWDGDRPGQRPTTFSGAGRADGKQF